MVDSDEKCLLGDVLLTNALKNDDVLDLDQMCAVIDSYRKAIVECRKMCLETEAQAYSRLAVVYSKVLHCLWQSFFTVASQKCS